jgi:pimeloyl-ACP methyl ester carboxylesterase
MTPKTASEPTGSNQRKGNAMTTSVQATPHSDSQLTAENLSIDVGDISFTYRRFGDAQTDALPLVMLQHFRGNLDSWDPLLVDGLARDREVVLVNNRGVGGSTGAVPENVTEMARDAIAFIDALGLERIDLLGFSLGGHVAQELVLLRPLRVRRLVLAGTAPQGGPDLHRWTDEVYSLATPDEPTADDLLGLFFSPSEQSRAKGMESIQRLYGRQADRDQPTDLATRDAQLAAITAWGIPDASKLNRLAGITQPTFVANGDNDTMMHTHNSQLLAEHLPNAELRIYPDAGHGFLNQYPQQFADDVRAFLSASAAAITHQP